MGLGGLGTLQSLVVWPHLGFGRSGVQGFGLLGVWGCRIWVYHMSLHVVRVSMCVCMPAKDNRLPGCLGL